MQDESFWVSKAQSAEAKFNTLQASVDRIKEDARTILETFAARKMSDGSFDIDFEKFVDKLDIAQALELRRIIDERHKISGQPGEKPHLRLSV